jgi:23S rRNA U2552 (ribose-2'-O)-methylase RlmE/FtsJ
MVKKYVYQIPSLVPIDDKTTDTYCELNKGLFSMLAGVKNDITHYHKRERKWERYKKMANEYELIHSSSGHIFPSIASIKPISRSYYKLHEIMTDLKTELGLFLSDMSHNNVAFLADAPGGFVQAFVDELQRQPVHNNVKRIHAISLLPINTYVPAWKLTDEYCEKNSIQLYESIQSRRPSCRCDLRDAQTSREFVAHVGRRSCALVTADGGFDFSSDFNDQESCAAALIASEVGIAIQIQAPKGAFILKMYDICSHDSIYILYILTQLYTNVIVHKPLTSRPANSEKYIICIGFRGHEHNDLVSNYITDLKDIVSGNPHHNAIPGNSFIRHVYTFNSVYVTNQILSIARTIQYIEKDIPPRDSSIVRGQLRKAMRWCHKYDVPIDKDALRSYKCFFSEHHRS